MESSTEERQDIVNLKYKKVNQSQVNRDMKRADKWRQHSLANDNSTSQDLTTDSSKIIEETPTSVHPPATITNLSPPHANTRSKTRSVTKTSILTPSPVPQVDGPTDCELVKPGSSQPRSERGVDWEHCENFPGYLEMHNSLLELKAICQKEKSQAEDGGAFGYG